MARKIFINYRRDDSAAHALTIAQYLERAFGARNVFIDIDRMRAGQKFPEVLEQRLAECKVMIVVIGPNWLAAREDGGRRLDDPADWVRLEIVRALARNITVIPVTVGGAHLPKRSELPEELRSLLDFHAVAITTNGFRSEMAGLLNDIRAIPGSSPRWRRMAAGLAAVVVLAAGVWGAVYLIVLPSPRIAPTPGIIVPGPGIAAGPVTPPTPVTRPVPAKPPLPVTPPGPPVDSVEQQRKQDEAKRQVQLRERIAATTDRAELVELMKQNTAERPAIEARLDALGYALVATSTASDRWLKAGGGREQGEQFKDCGANDTWCPEMVVVPSGHFLMGSPKDEPDRDNDEDDGNGKQVAVMVARPFAVSKFAATFDDWDACVTDRGCNGYRPDDHNRGRGRLPVIYVSWNDAKAYVDWLSKKTGKSYRLLSEAEREYVTRAGTTTPFWWGSSVSTSQANYDGNSTYGSGSTGLYRRKTEPVDRFAANPWGLYQVHGNVWEWVEDCYHKSYGGMPSAMKDGAAPWVTGCEKTSDGKDVLRVPRGGSWGHVPRYLRSASRNWFRPDLRANMVGFRVARML